MENNVHQLHTKYKEIALDWIGTYKGDFSDHNKKELLETLEQVEKEFFNQVKSLPKKKIEDISDSTLLSMQDLKYKFIQNIAHSIGGTENILVLHSMTQLVEYISGGSGDYIADGLVDNLNQKKEIPHPDIKGTIEQIQEIILPPDILERIKSMFLGSQQEKKEKPAGFDKIGLIEEFLSEYLGRKRTTFHRKEGVLRFNQMRQVSYFHLYLPEIDKTLLLNNQYGEGCFMLDGDFDIREAKKSDIKGTEGIIILHFNYTDPNKFLDMLGVYLSKNQLVKISENTIKKDEEGKNKESRKDIIEGNILQIFEKDGTIQIEGKIYQKIYIKESLNELWGVKIGTIYKILNEQGQERKTMYMKKIKSERRYIYIYEKDALKLLLKNDIERPKLKENGTVEINGKNYKRVGVKTPSTQLWGLTGEYVSDKIKKQSQERKDKYIKKAKGNGHIVNVCQIEALKKILKDEIIKNNLKDF